MNYLIVIPIILGVVMLAIAFLSYRGKRSTMKEKAINEERRVFFEKYKGCLSNAQFDRYLYADDCTSIFSIFSKQELLELDTLKEQRRKSDNVLRRIATLNNKGIQLEKEGSIEGAIEVYEECFNVMFNNRHIYNRLAWHSIDRLRILYKKTKHSNEKEYLLRAFQLFQKYDVSAPESFVKRFQQLNK